VYRDGTTHIVMSPLEFMQRLAALVPRPRLHLIRFHGVLAPHARLRAAIVPGAAENTSEHAAEHAHGAPARLSWARLFKRYRCRTLSVRSDPDRDDVALRAGRARRNHRLTVFEATILSAASMPNMRPALRHPQ